MRLSLLSFATIAGLFTVLVKAFSVPTLSPHPPSSAAASSVSFLGRHECLWQLSSLGASDSSSEISRTKPLSPDEIKARMREKEGLPHDDDDDEPPKLFSEGLYDDMRLTLLALEKRVKEGPGVLSILEVEETFAQTQRILAEMRQFEASRLSGMENAGVPASPNTATPAAAMATEILKSKQFIDTSDEEGPAYDGKGGLGLAKGTVNTYVIDGMDEMSPEEYQTALQQSIINRQKVRHGSGAYGNRATWDYLNNLSGDKGVLKQRKDADQP